MQHNLKLGRVVQVGFGSVLGILVAVSIVSRWATNQVVTSNAWVSHTYQVKGELDDITNLLINAETGQRGFLLTNRDDFLEPYNTARNDFDKTFDEISQLISDNPEQLARLRDVKQLSQQKMDELVQTVVLAQSGDRDQAINRVVAGRGKQLMDQIRVSLKEMADIEDSLLTERQAAVDRATTTAMLVSLGGALLAIAFGLAILTFIAREIVQPINSVANTIAASSNEIATTIEQQERTATEQASSVSETTTTMDELSASAQQTAQQAETAAAGSQQVLILTDQGKKAVNHTLENMDALTNKVSAVADQILRLSEQTSQIGSISGLVSDLANQTNMLALNAAVEAVRAGEQGKGFAVVAAEIRKLADQSKKSAEKINALVTDIQSAINSTVMVTDESTKTAQQGADITQQTADVFNNVADSISNVVLNIQQISLNTKQQAIAIQQVVQAMGSLSSAARENAAGIGQTRAGTHQLNDAARRLQNVV